MNRWWEKHIERADELARESPGTQALVSFYAQLLRSQKEIYEHLRSKRGWLPSGELEIDLSVLIHALPILLSAVETHGPGVNPSVETI